MAHVFKISFSFNHNLLETSDLGKMIHIFAAFIGTFQMLPLILENSPLPCIIAIFFNKIPLEIMTFSSLFKCHFIADCFTWNLIFMKMLIGSVTKIQFFIK